MKSSLTILKRAVPLAVAALCVAGAAQAALLDRDLNGDAVVDAFYDTDLDITWLRDANVNGLMNWDAAKLWASTLDVHGLGGWRLPSSDNCMGYSCTGSEMGHLWYTELGNTAGEMTNTGDFQNLLHDVYWSSEHELNPDVSWLFDTRYGHQSIYYKGLPLYAMAVRDGDVPSIPEPGTYALMLAGLAGLALARRRWQR